MAGTDAMSVKQTGAGKVGKSALIGFLGVGLACLGCCLAPILGTVALAGTGASLLALISNRPLLASLVAGSIGLAILWIWKSQRMACCATPNATCSSNGCGMKPLDSGK